MGTLGPGSPLSRGRTENVDPQSSPVQLSLTNAFGSNNQSSAEVLAAKDQRRCLRYVAAIISARDASQRRQKCFAPYEFIKRLALAAFGIARPFQNHGQGLFVE